MRISHAGQPRIPTNRFSSVPNRKHSRYSARRLPEDFGRPDGSGRRRLYCTLNDDPNPTFGFYLRLRLDPAIDALDSLRSAPKQAPAAGDERIFCWDMLKLRESLSRKHRETFWVKAATRGPGATEEFRYFEVEHTQGPLVANLAPLIDTGHVTRDIFMRLEANQRGGLSFRENMYLVKIWASDLQLLFRTPRK